MQGDSCVGILKFLHFKMNENNAILPAALTLLLVLLSFHPAHGYNNLVYKIQQQTDVNEKLLGPFYMCSDFKYFN